MSQIRLNKTPEMEEVLAYLRGKYRILSEAEIIKVALAEKYKTEMGDIPLVDEKAEQLIAKGMQDFKNGRANTLFTDEDVDKYLDSL